MEAQGLIIRSSCRLGCAEFASKLPLQNAIFDGEIVCIDERGVSRFNKLLRRGANPIFYAFDLLWLNDNDLRKLPSVERKEKLQGLIKSGWPMLYAQHLASRYP